jgi:hypothetical protein
MMIYQPNYNFPKYKRKLWENNWKRRKIFNNSKTSKREFKESIYIKSIKMKNFLNQDKEQLGTDKIMTLFPKRDQINFKIFKRDKTTDK